MNKNIKKLGIYFGLLSMLMTGCKKNTEEKKTYNGKIYTQVYKELEENGNKLADPIFNENYHELESVNLDYLDDYFDTEGMYDYDIKCTPKEFTELMNYNDITYENVIEQIDMANVSLDTKKILYNGVYGLVKENFNIPLGPLYYTMANLTEEVVENVDYDAKYNPKECRLYINKNAENKEYAITREVIGEGCQTAYVKGEKTMLSSFKEYYLHLEKDGSEPEICIYGDDIEKGLACIVENIATGKEIENYSDCEKAYMVMYLSERFNISTEVLISGGYKGFVEELINNGYNEEVNKLPKLEEDNFQGVIEMTKIIVRRQLESGMTKEEILKDIEEKSNCYLGKLKIATDSRDMFAGWGDFSPVMIKMNVEYTIGKQKTR